MTPTIRALRADDFPEADRIFRLAFGTFVGLPDPLAFAGDADFTRDRLAGLAVCHYGAGERFERLLDACAAFAAARGLGALVAGVDTGQRDAYGRMLARGFRTLIQGVVSARRRGRARSARPPRLGGLALRGGAPR